jgi:hypothetical protein
MRRRAKWPIPILASGLVAVAFLSNAVRAGETPLVCGKLTDADYFRIAFVDLFTSAQSGKVVEALRLAYPAEVTGKETPDQLTAYFKQKFPTCCTVTRQQTNFSDDPLEWFLSFFFYKIADVYIGAIANTPSARWQLFYDYYIDECGKMLKASRNLLGPRSNRPQN